jgi:hypothetical protein
MMAHHQGTDDAGTSETSAQQPRPFIIAAAITCSLISYFIFHALAVLIYANMAFTVYGKAYFTLYTVKRLEIG